MTIAHFFAAAALLLVCPHAVFGAVDVYVQAGAPSVGQDGSKAHPFSAPTQARDTLRALSLADRQGSTVYMSGTFTVASTSETSLLALDARDNGSPAAPVVWTSWDANASTSDTVVPPSTLLSGGVRIHSSAFDPVASLPMPLHADLPPQVLITNLTSAGILDLGSIQANANLKDCANNKAELFYSESGAADGDGGSPMNLARWPNLDAKGDWVWAHATGPYPSGCNSVADNPRRASSRSNVDLFDVVDDNRDASVPCIGFTFNATEGGGVPSARWVNETDAWLHGYWTWDWSDQYVHVQSVNPIEHVIEMGAGRTVAKNGSRWYVTNALSELDSPGEYYISRSGDTAGLLFFYPPAAPTTDSTAFISVAEHVVTLQDAAHIHFKDVSFMHSRGSAIVATNVNSVVLDACLMANVGGNGTDILNSTNSIVMDSEIADVSCHGLSVTGGDHLTLAPCNNVVSGNNIHHYARWKRTYMPGVFWAGVGGKVVNNAIAFGPHNAILGGANEAVCDPATNYTGPCGGSDWLFANNSISDVAYECSDTGAFYSCGQASTAWVTRGNAVIGNTFTRVRMTEQTSLGYPAVQAIYLDDQNSGWFVADNVFIDCQTGMFIGGGRDNVVKRNRFERCDTAVHIDNRGMNWEASPCQGDLAMAKIAISTWPAWDKYGITVDDPCVPVNNTVDSNVYCKCKAWMDASATDIKSWHDIATNNTEYSTC